MGTETAGGGGGGGERGGGRAESRERRAESGERRAEGRGLWADPLGTPGKRGGRSGTGGGAAGGRDNFEATATDSGAIGEEGHHGWDVVDGIGMFGRRENLGTVFKGVGESRGGHGASGV